MNSFTRIGLRSRFLLVLMIGLILPTLSVWGQNATITGKVVDPKGEPLVGVSVLEQGTTNGTVTDMNGRYSIVVQKDSSPLRFINLSLFNCFPHFTIEYRKCKYFIQYIFLLFFYILSLPIFTFHSCKITTALPCFVKFIPFFEMNCYNKVTDKFRLSECQIVCINRMLFTGRIIMSSKGNLILAIMWLLRSPFWFLFTNTTVGMIWLAGGIL